MIIAGVDREIHQEIKETSCGILAQFECGAMCRNAAGFLMLNIYFDSRVEEFVDIARERGRM